MARMGHPIPQPAEFTHSTPDAFLRDVSRPASSPHFDRLLSTPCTILTLKLEQLEALVSSLEDSFASSESTLETKTSPRLAAKLQVEKERRQKLLGKISQVLNASSGTSIRGSEMSLASEDDSMSFSHAEGECENSSAEWKRTTLLRLRKFLKKKYRQKKSRSWIPQTAPTFPPTVWTLALKTARLPLTLNVTTDLSTRPASPAAQPSG